MHCRGQKMSCLRLQNQFIASCYNLPCLTPLRSWQLSYQSFPPQCTEGHTLRYLPGILETHYLFLLSRVGIGLNITNPLQNLTTAPAGSYSCSSVLWTTKELIFIFQFNGWYKAKMIQRLLQNQVDSWIWSLNSYTSLDPKGRRTFFLIFNFIII